MASSGARSNAGRSSRPRSVTGRQASFRHGVGCSESRSAPPSNATARTSATTMCSRPARPFPSRPIRTARPGGTRHSAPRPRSTDQVRRRSRWPCTGSSRTSPRRWRSVGEWGRATFDPWSGRSARTRRTGSKDGRRSSTSPGRPSRGLASACRRPSRAFHARRSWSSRSRRISRRMRRTAIGPRQRTAADPAGI